MPDALQCLLADLKQENSLKAWSLIITFFGDSVAPRGGAVSVSTIQSVMALCGIGSGTVRTALSRLCKDGWVERDKSGRNSFYRLSEKGAAQSVEASSDIYACPRVSCDTTQPLSVIITTPEHPIPADKASEPILLHSDVYLVPANYTGLSELDNRRYIVAEVTNDSLPDWIETVLLPESLASKYRKLCDRVEDVRKRDIKSPADALALRTILIHEWRRLRLRPEQINQTIRLTAQHRAHQIVADLYHELSFGADQWLQEFAQGPGGLLPVPCIEIEERFR